MLRSSWMEIRTIDRRWACARDMKPWKGHKFGSQNFEAFLENCLKLGISQVSAYVLSTENLNRSKREVLELLRLMKKHLNDWEKKKKTIFDRYEVKVRFCGNLRKLPPDLVRIMKRIMKRTEKYHKRMLNILVAYGGRFELTEAVKNIAREAIKTGKIEITEKTIEENLLISGEVDLIIRTGGMHRLSNLLPWQSIYANLYVTECLWPDFNKKELIKAIKWYNNVKKKFGK